MKLSAGPNLGAVGAHIGDAIHRLHRSVREIRQVVNGFELFGGAAERVCGISLLLRHDARFAREFGILFALRAAVERSQRAIVPRNLQCLARSLSGPESIRDHRNAALDFNHVLHTGNGFRLIRIEALKLAAKDRRARNDRDEHSRHVHIQAEDRFAVRLVRRVEPLRRFAD